MKRKAFFTILIALLLMITISQLSCASAPASVPPKTVTTTQTVTVPTTQTMTVTPQTVTVTPSPSLITVPPPTTYTNPTTPPVISQITDNNNPHFFAGQDVSEYTKTVNADGSVTQTPVVKDLYLDVDLGGFFTQKDAIFIPKIPGVTTQDAWILNFAIPTFKLPFLINWGYMPAPNSPKSAFTLIVFERSNFKNIYNTNQASLTGGGLAHDDLIAANGVHLSHINQQGDLIAFVRVTNANDVQGWWIKFGGTAIK